LAPQKYSCNQRRSHPAHPTQLVRSAKEVAMEFYKDAFFGEIFLTPKRREQSKSDRSVFGNYFPLHSPYFRFSKKKKKKVHIYPSNYHSIVNVPSKLPIVSMSPFKLLKNVNAPLNQQKKTENYKKKKKNYLFFVFCFFYFFFFV
jgi:hypothetical protein